MPANLYRLSSFFLSFAAIAVTIGAWATGSEAVNAEPAEVQQDSVFTSVTVGFDGIYKLGHWTPVRIVAQSRVENVRVVVPDGDGIMCEFPLTASQENGEDVFTGNIRVGQSRTTLQILYGREEELEEYWPLPPGNRVSGTQRLVLVVGSDIGVADALRTRSFSEQTSVRTVNTTSLPDAWYGYDGVDLVVLTTGNETRYSEQEYGALDEWVRMGGKLILSVAKNSGDLIAAGKPLASLIPGAMRRVKRQRTTTELETFVGAKDRLDVAWASLPRADQGVPMTQLESLRGKVVVAEGTGKSSTPWVIRSAHGFGSVTFVTCDLDLAPIAEWSSRKRLLAALLDTSLMHRSFGNEGGSRGQVSHLGFNDLSGQLRAAMDQYGGVRLIPFSLIAALAIGYVVLVGPIDFFALRKFAPRMEWTWLTFPLIVLGMSALAVGLAGRWKAATPKGNVVDLLDVDVETGRMRCASWANFYYPKSGKHDFTIDPSDYLGKSIGELVSWQGLPGSAFGGMQNRAPVTNLVEPYTCRLDRVEQLPIPKWSSRGLSATWWGQTHAGESELKVSREELLSGSIENPLPVAIRDAVICYGRSYYEIGTLGPDAMYQVGEMAHPRDFRFRLTRRRIVDDRELIESWTKEDLHVPRIIEMMMFHDKAGGRGYTDLLSRYHHELDLSDHLDTGAAVLYGRITKPATVWHDNDTAASADAAKEPPKTWTFCRLIFPVEVNTQSRYRPQE